MSKKDKLKEMKEKWIAADDELLKEFDFYNGNFYLPEMKIRLMEKRFYLLMGVTSALFGALIDESDKSTTDAPKDSEVFCTRTSMK